MASVEHEQQNLVDNGITYEMGTESSKNGSHQNHAQAQMIFFAELEGGCDRFRGEKRMESDIIFPPPTIKKIGRTNGSHEHPDNSSFSGILSASSFVRGTCPAIRPTCLICLRHAWKYYYCPSCLSCLAELRFLHSKITRAQECWNLSLERAFEALRASSQAEAVSLETLSNAISLRMELETLSHRLEFRKKLLAQKKEKLILLRRKRLHYEKIVRNLQNGLDSWGSLICEKQKKIDRKTEKKGQVSLEKVRKKLVDDQLLSIFPLGLVSPEDNTTADETVVDALAEATLTNFDSGRWICGKPTDLHVFKVAGCRVSDFSDFADLKDWLYRRKATEQLVEPSRSTLSTLAGIVYVGQLLDVVSRVYDIFLPFRLNYRQFIILDGLSEDQMDTFLLKLKANIAFLCYARGLNDVGICFSRPICNLYTLSQNLNSSFSCQGGAYEVPVDFVDSFKSAVEEISWAETNTSGDADWEKVTEDNSEWAEIPRSTATLTNLITSATSSVTSLFRTT